MYDLRYNKVFLHKRHSHIKYHKLSTVFIYCDTGSHKFHNRAAPKLHCLVIQRVSGP